MKLCDIKKYSKSIIKWNEDAQGIRNQKGYENIKNITTQILIWNFLQNVQYRDAGCLKIKNEAYRWKETITILVLS
jgi:hypothetical protein